MLVIIGAFCTQDVPGGHACSAHSLVRCCSVCCEQSLCVDDMCIYICHSRYTGFLKSMARFLSLDSATSLLPHKHKQDVSFLRCAPQSTGIRAVDPPFRHPLKDTVGLNLLWAAPFYLPFVLKWVSIFFSSFPLSAGPGCLGTCAKTSQLGEYRRGGQRYALEPPPHFMHAKSLSCPTMPFVHWTHSCTNTNTQGHKQKSTFSKAHTSITGSLTLFA